MADILPSDSISVQISVFSDHVLRVIHQHGIEAKRTTVYRCYHGNRKNHQTSQGVHTLIKKSPGSFAVHPGHAFKNHSELVATGKHPLAWFEKGLVVTFSQHFQTLDQVEF